MAAKKIATYTGKKLACGAFFTADVDALLKLDAVETTRAIVLESERVTVKLKNSDGTLTAYTVSVNITREPQTDDERAAVKAFTDDVTKRKTEREAKDEKARRGEIETAYRYGKDGVVSALASLKDIAPAIHVLSDIQKSVSKTE